MTDTRPHESAQPSAERPQFTSPFGGLWVDRRDADRVLAHLSDHHIISQAEGRLLHDFCRLGYVILPGAISAELADRVREDTDRLWRSQSPLPRVEASGAAEPMRAELRGDKTKLLDLYAFSEAAREAAFAPAIARFLTILFGGQVRLFQSLTFEHGTEQPMHQDAAYVVVSSPRQLAAAWIALQDVEPGSGELEYYESSHRLEDYLFGGTRKSWNPRLDGDDSHEAFLASLHTRAQALGLARRRLHAKKGDVLIWHADLVHGGSPIERPAPRHSLVCHYCPGRVLPFYFRAAPERSQTHTLRGNCHYASRYYDLGDPAVRALLP